MTHYRSTREVFESHLELALEWALERDLERNFAEDCVLLTGFGLLHGHQGVRVAAHRLAALLPGARFRYGTRLCHGGMAFLEWEADAEGARVEDGADSYLIREGSIRVMSIHYTVRGEAAVSPRDVAETAHRDGNHRAGDSLPPRDRGK